jgi:hypothetical protein
MGMNDFINMNMKFVNSPFINELKYTQKQEGEDKFIEIMIIEGEKKTKITLKNPHPLEDVFHIIDAKRIWIEDEGSTQKDYGRFKIGYSDEAYSEFWVDSVEQQIIE